ncbi:DNA-binding transcriptional LysR family regulator [Pseudoduganella flava]|uniref:DNA-binding transcriptional LysR family regulator n=1 Tax=Pseudoduganella flava TaxID=871742 RepID=A0A562PK49_9BURK|nr:LysR family transcriptional regulator [Pseudoduganella flava]QGZ42223.1 LysR family transcriptional regulator [Pseudoduganella flava]TWI44758.1 DNA-binding transcriptional LysR family regulator [Pseudoduganella flava]
METKWLEDFISLVETSNFSRSAQLRHVTQPAFSRRIQSLENWLGTDLIDRTTFPTRLTPAGHVFYEQALEMLGQINGVREMLRHKRAATQTTIDLAVPHTLSLTFVPKWLTQLEEGFGAEVGPLHSRLMALNVHDAVLQLVDGGCDLLLCYHHPRQPVQLDPGRYDMLVMGREALRAYARCKPGKQQARQPEFQLPGRKNAPLPFLSYTPNAYLGRMVDLILADAKPALHLDKRYETDMAEGLKMMALEGRGIAFLPESAVTREVKQKLLARADEGGTWEIEMEIRLYRERPSAARPGKAVVGALWEYLEEQLQPARSRRRLQASER